jgi:hypothetical protein
MADEINMRNSYSWRELSFGEETEEDVRDKKESVAGAHNIRRVVAREVGSGPAIYCGNRSFSSPVSWVVESYYSPL